MESKKRVSLIIGFIAIFFCFNAYSQKEPGAFRFEVSSTQTSDDFKLRQYELDFRNNRRNFFYPYNEALESAIDYGLHLTYSEGGSDSESFQETTIRPYVAYKPSLPWLFEAGVGATFLNTDNFESSFMPWYAEASHKSQALFQRVSFSRSSTIIDLRYPKSYTASLKSDEARYSLLWTPQKIRFRVNARHEWLSDDNVASYLDLETKYNLSFDKYWLLIGVGGEVYHNKVPQDGYWTPKEFFSFGPRFEMSGPVAQTGLFFNIGCNLNRFIDEFGNSGNGHYINATIQTSERNSNHFKVGFERVRSKQEDNIWYSNRPYISYNLYW